MAYGFWRYFSLLLLFVAILQGCGKSSEAKRETAASPPPPVEAPKASESAWEKAAGFPLPAPKPSARLEIPNNDLTAPAQPATLGSVADKLVSALDAAGYSDYTFMPAPDGFALVTQLEKIRRDGSPDLHQRFGVNLTDAQRRYFSLSDYLKALFTADVAHYRVVVFLVVPQTVQFAQSGASAAQVEQWGGFDRLPQTVRAQSFDIANGFHCVALVYEFAKDQFDTPAVQSLPGSVSGRQHLEKAGIWAKLAK